MHLKKKTISLTVFEIQNNLPCTEPIDSICIGSMHLLWNNFYSVPGSFVGSKFGIVSINIKKMFVYIQVHQGM